MAVNNRDDDDQIEEVHLDAIADADPYPYWYDDADEPDSNPTLVRTETCDLCVVGGGYTGLWTAIIAKERDPSRDIVLIVGRAVQAITALRSQQRERDEQQNGKQVLHEWYTTRSGTGVTLSRTVYQGMRKKKRK